MLCYGLIFFLSVSGGKRIRAKVLHSEESSWTHTKRKIRSDCISEENKKLVFEFWKSPEISRPTCNKNDVKRIRISKNNYISHMKYVLEKTQTECYSEFKSQYPEIKISQRLFEKCRPYFVSPARERHRNTCCCRYHTEIRYVFESCMKFRKNKHAMWSENDQKEYIVFDRVTDLVATTLCPKNSESGLCEKKCIDRECRDCGVSNFKLHESEMTDDDTAPDVSWSKYEYVNLLIKGRTLRKLMLVQKRSKPKELFQYFTEILRTYPSHSFRASWQNKQMRKLIECLPPDECVAIHDFSENYSCSEKDELQSTFFSKAECTLHVTILYRHARVDIDGEEMTENKRIVCEQFFVISPDIKHDNYFSKNVQKLVSDYLKEINYHVNCMHEFTDGCSVQYKSRNCMGDVSLSSDLGYGKIIRNYFETSHAKGQQDAAGGCIKHMADMAVIRGTSVIQNAQDLFDFAVHNLSSTKSKNKRRLFRYIDQADRSELRNFKPIKNNRKIHQIISENSDGLLKIRDLSCYSCDTCLDGNVTLCTNRSYCGQVTQVKMVQTQTKTNETSDTCENSPDFRSLVGKGVVVAVYTDDNDSEYYLLQVVASPFILSSFSTDQWGNSFDAGTDVLRGYYYDKVDDQRYKLLSGRIAIVPTLSIRYIVSAVGCYKKSITILDETHINIMESIDIHDM